jgi:hypothetical protein
VLDLGADPEYLASLDVDELAELIYYAGQYDATYSGDTAFVPVADEGRGKPSGGCGCKK